MKERVRQVLVELERAGNAKFKADMKDRYGIVAPRSWGVPVGRIKQLGKKLGRDHDLALALWDTGWYEARMLAAFIGEPDKLTPALMDRWAKDWDNWGIVDTVCFALFDRSPLAWSRIAPWAKKKDEWIRRGGYVLIACLSGHDKTATDAQFKKLLPLIEQGASDDRNFVKKGVAWAIRSLGLRKGMKADVIALAKRLANRTEPSAQWLGRQALRELKVPIAKAPARKPVKKGAAT